MIRGRICAISRKGICLLSQKETADAVWHFRHCGQIPGMPGKNRTVNPERSEEKQ